MCPFYTENIPCIKKMRQKGFTSEGLRGHVFKFHRDKAEAWLKGKGYKIVNEKLKKIKKKELALRRGP